MSKVLVTEELPISAKEVWELASDFAGIQRWSSMVQDLEVEGEGVGAVRTFSAGGVKLQEELRAQDDGARRFQYAIIGDNPLPFTDYLATFQVSETGADSCRVDWSSTFEPRGVPEDQAQAIVRSIYEGGLAGIKKALGI